MIASRATTSERLFGVYWEWNEADIVRGCNSLGRGGGA